MRPLSRRAFLHQSSLAAGGVSLAGVLDQLLTRSAYGAERSEQFGYGPLSPVADETTGLPLLKLPEGFRYQSFGWYKQPMSSGQPTPAEPDGMAVIAADEKTYTLCRNHEVSGNGKSFAAASISYDAKAGGGCTNLVFDHQSERFAESRVSLGGTVKNCAGGPTPWGTWLSCEETVLGPGSEDDGERMRFEREHGYIFEVPAVGAASAQPLRAMGRFVHEAVAVDPQTGIVYETEDRGTAGFYRFLPNVKQQLAQGGRLQMMKLKGIADVRKGVRVGQGWDVTWVDIEDPERAHSPGTKDELGVFKQGTAQGGATFARLEGCWYGNQRVYLVSTNGGEREVGQIFEYSPAEETIRLIFESPAAEVLEKPDNIAVCPKGALLLCEDGDLVPQRLHGLTTDGKLFPFAANNIILKGEPYGFRGDFRGEEWAGATFSPDGRWLFVNIMEPGMTFAITGPWERGPLG